MSAAEIIEQIKSLPETEQVKVSAFMDELMESKRGRSGDNKFEEAKKWVFREHDELLRRLAQ